MTASENIPSTFSNGTEATVTWTYRNGDWHGTCQGSWRHVWHESEERPDETGTFSRTFEASNPPHWPLFNTRSPPAVGGEVRVWTMEECDIHNHVKIYSGLEPSKWGIVHNADDTQEAEDHYSDFDTWWDPGTGLVLGWDWGRLHSGASGEITSTDAPLS